MPPACCCSTGEPPPQVHTNPCSNRDAHKSHPETSTRRHRLVEVGTVAFFGTARVPERLVFHRLSSLGWEFFLNRWVAVVSAGGGCEAQSGQQWVGGKCEGWFSSNNFEQPVKQRYIKGS